MYGRQKVEKSETNVGVMTTHVLYTQYNTYSTTHVLYTQYNTYTHLYGRQKVGETGTQVGVMATRVLREESYHGGAQGGSIKDGQQNGHV